MFDFSNSRWAVSAATTTIFSRAWMDLAAPGTNWTGSERVGIAAVARLARQDGLAHDTTTLPQEASEAATKLSINPSSATKEWVEETTGRIGEGAYVELVGVVSTVTAIDTHTQLLGQELEPLPEPLPGNPIPIKEAPKLRRNRAWVSLAGQPAPRWALSAVPPTLQMTNDLIDHLYMTRQAFNQPGRVRHLTREQAEAVVVAVSLANECFY